MAIRESQSATAASSVQKQEVTDPKRKGAVEAVAMLSCMDKLEANLKEGLTSVEEENNKLEALAHVRHLVFTSPDVMSDEKMRPELAQAFADLRDKGLYYNPDKPQFGWKNREEKAIILDNLSSKKNSIEAGIRTSMSRMDATMHERNTYANAFSKMISDLHQVLLRILQRVAPR